MVGKQLTYEGVDRRHGAGQPAALVSASQQDVLYTPVGIRWEGSKAELLEGMFRFYPSIPVEPTMDATEQRRPILAQFKAAGCVNGY